LHGVDQPSGSGADKWTGLFSDNPLGIVYQVKWDSYLLPLSAQ
jgi:hypothetical protein